MDLITAFPGLSPRVLETMVDAGITTGNPLSALPADAKSAAQQSLDMQKKHLDLEYQQALAAVTRAEAELRKEGDQELMNKWELAMKDPNMPEDMREGILRQVAAKLGGHLEETTNWLRRGARLVGLNVGKTYQYAPDVVAPEMIKDFVEPGSMPQAETPGFFQSWWQRYGEGGPGAAGGDQMPSDEEYNRKKGETIEAYNKRLDALNEKVRKIQMGKEK